MLRVAWRIPPQHTQKRRVPETPAIPPQHAQPRRVPGTPAMAVRLARRCG